MKTEERIGRHLLLALALAAIFYVAFFAWIEHRRAMHGPWVIDFKTDSAGRPALLITETNLHIRQGIRFTDGTNLPPNMSRTVVFSGQVLTVPYGKLLFQDPTFLPGTVTLRLWGHTVEMIPRVLKIDSQEYQWGKEGTINVR